MKINFIQYSSAHSLQIKPGEYPAREILTYEKKTLTYQLIFLLSFCPVCLGKENLSELEHTYLASTVQTFFKKSMVRKVLQLNI